MADHTFWVYSIAFFGIILGRYFLVAGGIYILLYSSLGQQVTHRPWQHRYPSWHSIRQDIVLSSLSAAVFAIAAAFILSAYHLGMTRLYSHPQAYGLWYLGVSYGIVLLLQDTYFYFTHRLFHHPSLFPWVHQGHHRARYHNPWTSFAFDPLEAVIQALFLVGIILIMPIHFITLIAVLTTMTIWAVVNHLGLNYLPTSFPHHWLGKWVIGPAHHSIHHRHHKMHYGLYFTFWDKLLGTQDPNYETQLEAHLRPEVK